MKSTLLLYSENVFLQALSTMRFLELVVFEKMQQTTSAIKRCLHRHLRQQKMKLYDGIFT